MEVVPADILVIGAGGAGLRAAISIAETSSSLAVSLLSKVYPMRSHTVAAEGGAAGVIKDNDSFDDHFHDTVGGGDWLSDQNAVELFVKTAPLELTQIEHWGCPWSPASTFRLRPLPREIRQRLYGDARRALREEPEATAQRPQALLP